MIKNLLWKQAMKLAKKKFGDLNTNEANKWLVDKYNALLGKENTKNIANKIREDLKRDRPFEGFKPEVVPKIQTTRGLGELWPKQLEKTVEKAKKFDPFKKEGKKIDFMDYYTKRKRGEFDEGGMILPQPKPYNFEEKIEFLKKIKSGVGPKTYLQIMSDTLNEGVEKEAITKEERDNFLKRFTGTISEDWTSAIDDENLYMYEGDYERYPPKFNEGGLAGMLGETQPQQVGLAQDREALVRKLYDAAGGFEGTNKTFLEFMADVMYEGDYIYAKGGRVGYEGGGYVPLPLGRWNDISDAFEKYQEDNKNTIGPLMGFKEFFNNYIDNLASGGRVGLKGGGMTPSEKWMRNYYYDGKGGYDTWMSFQEFQMGPGVELWNRHIGKYAEGGRAGYLKGGLLRVGIMEALDKLTRKGRQVEGVDIRETILPTADAGDWAVNFGEVRDLFKNLDKTFAGKITSKESIDDIITRFRDTRKLDLSKNIKEFLNNKIKGYKEELNHWSNKDIAPGVKEDLKYLIKATKEDIKLIDKYGLTQQSKKATKHAEGGIVGLSDGGLLEKYKEYAPKGPWTRGLTDAEITFELYNLLEPYMSLFMKEGGRVGFKEGKGMSRRTFLKLMGAAATLPVVGKFFKLAKPAAKVMDDIKITLRGDGDWEQVDEMWSGGNWVNYSFEALTDKGKQILAKLSKGKNASLVDQGDGVYFPGKTVKSKAGNYLTDEADYAVDAVDSIKKAKGNISLNTQVGSKVKGAKPEKYKDMDLGYSTKTYGSKEITKKNILDEADDLWVGDYGGYRNKGFYDENVEEIIDIITKKAEGGRVGLYKGGIIDLLIKGGKFLNKNSPVELYKKYLKSVKDRTLKANETGKFTDLPLEVIPIAASGALVTNYLKKKLKSLDEQTEEKAEGGRIGLDAGGPPIMPVQLGPLQLQPRASGSFTTGQPYGPNFKEKTWTDNIGISGMLDLPGGFSLTGDYDKFRTKDRLYTADDEYVDERVRGDHDAWNVGINWKKEFADGGSVLQRPMFYQGGLTKTIPPERGPMPQGLQSDVYDGIMRPGVINGRN